MTPKAKMTYLTHLIRRDRQRVEWWIEHRPRPDVVSRFTQPASFVSDGGTWCLAMGAAAPPRVCSAATSLPHAVDLLARMRARLAPSSPPHNALWQCLLQHEGGGDPHNQDTGGNGHWGGLQMHPGWGYGTSWHASDDPWSTQKWAAERGYAASGYSRAWLEGQWGQTLGYCWRYE